MLAPVLVTPPEADPVTVVEAKAFLNVTTADDNELIAALIAAATQHLDGYSGILGRALVTQEWRLDLRCWRYPVRIPLSPIQSIVVKYFDGNNAEQTLAADQYEFFTDALGPNIAPAYGVSWPSVYSRADALRVTITAGYGDPEDVPAPIKTAVLLMVGHWYANRETVGDGSLAELPMGATALLAPYRRIYI